MNDDRYYYALLLLALLTALLIIGLVGRSAEQQDAGPPPKATLIDEGLSASEPAATPARQAAPPLVRAARMYLNYEYRLGGRLTKTNPGLDCMGLVFIAWDKATGAGWHGLSVSGKKIIAEGQLGTTVPGLNGILTSKVDLSVLKPGDVVFLFGPAENPREKPLVEIQGVPYWIWHMGIYSGNGFWINADNYAGQVIEVDLLEYLRQHADFLSGIWAVRPKLPKNLQTKDGDRSQADVITLQDPHAALDILNERIEVEGLRTAPRRISIPRQKPHGLETANRMTAKTAKRKILINKSEYTLALVVGDQVIAVFPVGFGTNPVNDKLEAGDRCTPEGKFHVISKNGSGQSKYYKSLCLDYPTAETTAKRKRLMETGTPINPSAGRDICIHGSKNFPTIQFGPRNTRIINWTSGCVAMNNGDLDRVFEFMRVGDEVEIIWSKETQALSGFAP